MQNFEHPWQKDYQLAIDTIAAKDAEIAAKDAELQRWKMMHAQAEAQLNEYLGKTVAAEARERELREALQSTVDAIRESIRSGKSLNNIDFDQIGARALHALALPSPAAVDTGFDCPVCKPSHCSCWPSSGDPAQ